MDRDPGIRRVEEALRRLREVVGTTLGPAAGESRLHGRRPQRGFFLARGAGRRRDVSKRHGRPAARPAAAEVIVDGSRKRRPERHGA
jgi:hypothetical protein